jgi:hypothetical protein
VRAHELAVENNRSGRDHFLQYHVRGLVRMGLCSGASRIELLASRR